MKNSLYPPSEDKEGFPSLRIVLFFPVFLILFLDRQRDKYSLLSLSAYLRKEGKPMSHMNIRRMRELRLEKNMTQQELADLLGITVQAYNYAEKGRRSLKVSTLLRYQKVMGLEDAEMWRLCTGAPLPMRYETSSHPGMLS